MYQSVVLIFMAAHSIVSPRKRMRTLQENLSIQTTYYFVNINRPLKEQFLDATSLERATKGLQIDIDGGKFRNISTCSTPDGIHDFYLYEFKTSKHASGASVIDFNVPMKPISTSKILCDEQTCFVTIDLELTTMKAAEAALSNVEAALSNVVTEIVKMAEERTDHDSMIHRVRSLVPVTPTGAEAVKVLIPPLSFNVPEAMLNEMVKHQIIEKTHTAGFVVASNTGVIGSEHTLCTPFSQYFKSRPDLSIYHPDKQVGCVVQATQPEEETSEEMDKESVTIKAAVTENKLHVKDDLGQLLAGMDKVAGHIAYMHLQKYLLVEEKSFEIIEIYGLLCDYKTRKCKVYKLVMNFLESQSVLFCGQEDVCLATGMSRLIATLQSAK